MEKQEKSQLAIFAKVNIIWYEVTLYSLKRNLWYSRQNCQPCLVVAQYSKNFREGPQIR